MPTINQLTYQGWQAYELKNENLSLIIVPELGGRVVSFSRQGIDLLYTMLSLRGKTYDLEGIADIAAYRQKLDYLPPGGYKTWLAPQSDWEWPPYLDLAVGKYEVDYSQTEGQAELELTSPVCRESGMQFNRRISLAAAQSQVQIVQKMKNCRAQKQECGLWDVTQLAGQGQVIFPLPIEDDLESLSEEVPEQLIDFKLINDQLYVIIDCPGEVEFKVGTYFSAGWVLAVVAREEQVVGYLKTFPVFPEAEFGHGCALEVFDTYKFDYFEVEVHGPKTELTAGEETGFTENWDLFCWPQEKGLAAVIETVENNLP